MTFNLDIKHILKCGEYIIFLQKMTNAFGHTLCKQGVTFPMGLRVLPDRNLKFTRNITRISFILGWNASAIYCFGKTKTNPLRVLGFLSIHMAFQTNISPTAQFRVQHTGTPFQIWAGRST